MIRRLDGVGKNPAQEKSRHRHHGLEQTEPEAADQCRLSVRPLYRQSFAHRHREGIHAQANA